MSRSVYYDGTDDCVSLFFSRLRSRCGNSVRRTSDCSNNENVSSRNIIFLQICKLILAFYQSGYLRILPNGIKWRGKFATKSIKILYCVIYWYCYIYKKVNFNWIEIMKTCSELYGVWVDSRKSNCWNAYTVDWFLGHWLLNTHLRESRSGTSESEPPIGKAAFVYLAAHWIAPTCRAFI